MTVGTIAVIAGQSNALCFSTGSNGQVYYPGGFTPIMYGAAWSEPVWDGITGRYVQYNPGYSSWFDPNGGAQYWGVEASIAMCRRALPSPTPTYIVKVAEGGIGMAINPGGTDWSPWTNKLFGTLVSTVRAAIAALTPYVTSITVEFYGLFNETDTESYAAARCLKHDLPAFMAALRTALGVPIKFVWVRTKLTLGSASNSPTPYNLPYIDIVRAAQETVNNTPGATWVDADDIDSGNPSPGHYDPTTTGIVALGNRMYAAGVPLVAS